MSSWISDATMQNLERSLALGDTQMNETVVNIAAQKSAPTALFDALKEKFDAEALMATRAFDTDRLIHATAIGTIYGGLMLPFVYQVAEGLLPGRSPSKVIPPPCVPRAELCHTRVWRPWKCAEREGL